MSQAGETVVIVDYGSGNLHSAEKSVQRMAGPLSQTVVVSDDPDVVLKADRVILPGVGAFGDCAAGLRAVSGMTEALESRALGDGRPFLGICVGMQLMATVGVERGEHQGLDWIPGRVERLAPEDPATKVPHMGWNQLDHLLAHPVLDGLPSPAYAYFVHSYHFVPDDAGHILADVEYDQRVIAMVGRDNLIGAQFHPEKSQRFGLALIDRFLRWRP